jgi:hypothetical protein
MYILSQELKYSKQMAVPIVPVVVQQEWRAGGWLGILTVGGRSD